MKNAVALLLCLLSVHASRVCSQAYEADSNGNCRDPKAHYKLEGTNLCCGRCKPGHRFKKPCTMNSDTVCELCPGDQYLEQMNYSPNCIACSPCKLDRGLIYLQNCSPTTNSRCGCQPGMYCIMGFNNPYCELCRKYKTCEAGFGVSVPGTARANVKCEACPNGTFSDTVSYTDQCRPHTNCDGRGVAKQGNAMMDTVCKPESLVGSRTTTEEPRHGTQFTAASPSTVAAASVTESTVNISPRVTLLPRQTKSNSEEVSLSQLAAAIAGAAGALILLIAIVIFRWKLGRGKGAERRCENIDANGNHDAGDKTSGDYFKETRLISYTQEEECLLKEAEACSSQSQSSNSTDLLTRSDDCSSFESIGPSQSTAALHGPHSTALSEPMPLQSYKESAPSQTGVPTQPSSQPADPLVISPITTSPHVNVNITFNIGNGTPTSVMQSDCQLPFRGKEETFSVPQQEAGKEAVVTVQESTVICA